MPFINDCLLESIVNCPYTKYVTDLHGKKEVRYKQNMTFICLKVLCCLYKLCFENFNIFVEEITLKGYKRKREKILAPFMLKGMHLLCCLSGIYIQMIT